LVSLLRMNYKFPYAKAGIWYRPIIPITLKYSKREITYLALLDSGADFNIFHGDITKLLGINLSKQKNSMSFGGIREGASGKGYFMPIEIGINNKFFTTTAVFSNDISDDGYGIWGEQGFFNKYKILFNYPSKSIEIQS